MWLSQQFCGQVADGSDLNDKYLILLSRSPKLDIWFSGTESKMPSGSGSNYVMML